MSPSELKYRVNQAGHESHFFTHSTMKFFGDRMSNYGVRSAVIESEFDGNGEYVPGGVQLTVWELWRKRPVKHGLKDSAYFDAKTFRRVFPKAA